MHDETVADLVTLVRIMTPLIQEGDVLRGSIGKAITEVFDYNVLFAAARH